MGTYRKTPNVILGKSRKDSQEMLGVSFSGIQVCVLHKQLSKIELGRLHNGAKRGQKSPALCFLLSDSR